MRFPWDPWEFPYHAHLYGWEVRRYLTPALVLLWRYTVTEHVRAASETNLFAQSWTLSGAVVRLRDSVAECWLTYLLDRNLRISRTAEFGYLSAHRVDTICCVTKILSQNKFKGTFRINPISKGTSKMNDNLATKSINQSINQSLFAAISKYSVTVVNRQLWTGQWCQSTNHCHSPLTPPFAVRIL